MPKSTLKDGPQIIRIPFHGFTRKRRARQVATFLIDAGCLPNVVFAVDYKLSRIYAAVDLVTKNTYYVRVRGWLKDPLDAEWTIEPSIFHHKLRSKADAALLDHVTRTSREPMTLEMPIGPRAS